ncbi:hypothetical protein pipiens_017885, partial [Culex pipiens pipiens]
MSAASTLNISKNTILCHACAGDVNDEYVPCQGFCNAVFHLNCSGAKTELLKEIAAHRQIFWLCRSCTTLMTDLRHRRSVQCAFEAGQELSLSHHNRIVEQLKSEILSELKSELSSNFAKLIASNSLTPRSAGQGAGGSRGTGSRRLFDNNPAPPPVPNPLPPKDDVGKHGGLADGVLKDDADGNGIAASVEDRFWLYLSRVSRRVNEEQITKLAVDRLGVNDIKVKMLVAKASNIDVYQLHTGAVQQILGMAGVRDLVLVVGDYNLPALTWFFDDDTHSFLPINASAEQEVLLLESMLSCGLLQINNLASAHGNLLDLAFVSDATAAELIDPPCPLLKPDAHHKPILLKLDYDHGGNDDLDDADEIFDFNQCDYALLNERISAVDWDTLLDTSSVDESTANFYERLNSILHEVVPKKIRRMSHRYKLPWWNDELRTLRNRLRKATSRYMESKTAWDKVTVQNIEDEYNALNQESFRSYINNTQRSLKSDPSKFWSYVNSRKNANRTPTDVSYRDLNSTSPAIAANFFADFFKSVHSSDAIPPRDHEFEYVPTHYLPLPLPVLNDEETLKALSGVDGAKGPGPDGIPPSLIKACADSLTVPVKRIFNDSLRKGVYPAMWKVASITPIHKSGSTKKVENYRPISILNCLAKVLEKIVYDRLYAVNNVDCCSLQMDVNALLHWCESNGMKVHVKKCKVISFSRSRNPLRFDYTMGDGCPLDRVNSIRDLGVTVDRKMKFNEHIALTTGKAFAMLGFLKRNTAHFDDPFALKVLYASLVRSVLEYAAVVWAPYHVTLAARIERVQRAFVRFALRKLPWNNPLILPSYEGRCLLFRLQSLAERRTLMQRLFVFDLLRGNIDCRSIRNN